MEIALLKSDAEKPERGAAAPNNSDELKMTQTSVIILALYLSGFALLSFYMVYALWSAQLVATTGPVPSPDCSKTTAPALTHIYPLRIPVGASQDVWLVGCGFTDKTQVKFNGAPHQALFLDASHVRVGLTAAEVASAGPILAALSNGGPDFGTGSLSIVLATVVWQPFWFAPSVLNQEVQLLLLVFFVGALGSTVYALKSMSNYRGDRKLDESWFMYYGIQPFEGPGIAFLVYLVIRGGFLAGTGGDIKSANLFGICAFAGLAGTFSDIAYRKLREVFESLFRPQDNRTGKTGLTVDAKTLKPATVGQAYEETLQATGGITPLKWSVSPALPTGLSLDATTGVIRGTPTAVSKNAAYQFTATDSSPSPLSTTIPLALEVQAAGVAGGAAAAGAAAPAHDADGCDVAITDSTPDEELPATEGGVA
jgi:hypothetical protein